MSELRTVMCAREKSASAPVQVGVVSTLTVAFMGQLLLSGRDRDSVRERTVKRRDVKAWKAIHDRSETERLQVDKNRDRCGHMSTVGRSSEWRRLVESRTVGLLRAGFSRVQWIRRKSGSNS